MKIKAIAIATLELDDILLDIDSDTFIDKFFVHYSDGDRENYKNLMRDARHYVANTGGIIDMSVWTTNKQSSFLESSTPMMAILQLVGRKIASYAKEYIKSRGRDTEIKDETRHSDNVEFLEWEFYIGGRKTNLRNIKYT